MTKVIGLTGGIASGKSTVVSFLREKGYKVIDADAVVHELQARGGRLYQVLVAEFGQAIVLDNGEIDREKLGQAVFADPSLRLRLSSLQDRIIRQELLKRRDQQLGQETVLFMDIPLLYEADYRNEVDEVWLVYVDRKQQLARLMERNHLSVQEAENRLAAQWSLEEKRDQADRIIDNSRTKEEMWQQLSVYLKEV